jgi:hypothetical protein
MLSNFIPGKGDPRPPEPPIRRNERPAHAPVFTSEHPADELEILDEAEVLREGPEPPEPTAPHSRPHAAR